MQIALNFLPVLDDDLTFEVYRKAATGGPISAGEYKCRLPVHAMGTEDYSPYLISFQPRDGFDSFTVNLRTNRYLTLRILFEALTNKVRKVLDADKFDIPEFGFTQSVRFVLATYPEGSEVIDVQPYYLGAKSQFGFLIDFSFAKDERALFNQKVQILSLSLDRRGFSNRNFYADKRQKILNFIKSVWERLLSIEFNGKPIPIGKDFRCIEGRKLLRKEYECGRGKRFNTQFAGVKEVGPYNGMPDHDNCLFVFIFKTSEKQYANLLFSALNGKLNPATFPGMNNIFGVNFSRENVTSISMSEFTEDELVKTVKAMNEIVANNDGKKVVGIFVVDKPQGRVETFSPYLFMKYQFARLKIPLQTVTVDLIRKSDGLKWSASNIGLQIFTKLGGIPWRVVPRYTNCLIFGIGTAHRRNLNGEIVRYTAYSVCMDSSGIYKKLDVLSDTNDYDDYLERLKKNILTAVNTNMDERTERCVVHLPYKVKKDEIRCIRSGLSSLSSAPVKIQFLKINSHNKFFGFADTNSFVPYEGAFVSLNDSEFLVWFDGLQEGAENVNKRVGGPTHIQFLYDENVSEQEHFDYLQDVLNLAGANWRGFKAKKIPTSLYYPQLIAGLIADFAHYEYPLDFDLSLSRYPWFL